MAREVDILRYLPPILHEIKELQKISELENPTLEQVWQMVEDALNNQFVVSAKEDGLTRYEKMFKLVAGESEDIETRRFRVMSRYQERLPFSWLVVENSLDTLLGKGNYELTRSTSEKWIRVRLELTVQRQFEVVEMMLERVTPQNVILYVEIRYNQHSMLMNYTHQQLSAYTHQQLREEVIS